MILRNYASILATLSCICLTSSYVSAEETRIFSGMRGLNTIPNARFDPVGRTTLTISHHTPYTHSALGAQLTDRFYISMRQSSEKSNNPYGINRLYPGIDAKIKLWNEKAYLPQAAIGLQSAFGHKQTAGEFLALSKRWYNLDMTAGIGWGRFGSAGHMTNPLKTISHFNKSRQRSGEQPNGPEDWFTGEKIGFFGGVAYDLPYKGLTFTADWNADRYQAELAQNTITTKPAPWSIGLQYQPLSYIQTGIALTGTDEILTRVTLQPDIPSLTGTPKHKTDIHFDTTAADVGLTNIDQDGTTLHALISIDPNYSAPHIMQQALRYMILNSPEDVTSYELQPHFAGLQGPKLHISRRAIEQSQLYHYGSAEEIWRNTVFTKQKTAQSSNFYAAGKYFLWPSELKLEEQVSVSEVDHGILHRTSLIIGQQRPIWGKFIGGGAFRVNVSNNLENLNTYRTRAKSPTRSDIDLFAQRDLALDKLYLSYLSSITPDLHLGVTGGYLEEQYAGFGGELLLRPYDTNWALGLEAWQAYKRDPYTSINHDLDGDHQTTGHINAWYRFPDNPQTTLKTQLGRYLSKDIGGTVTLSHHFKNGAELEGFLTYTDEADISAFGEETYLYNGVRLSVPLGGIDYMPHTARLDIIAAPFGRDNGQKLQKPLDLYDLTEAFSLQHFATYWGDIAP